MEEENKKIVEATVTPIRAIFEEEDNDWKAYSFRIVKSKEYIETHSKYKTITIAGDMPKLDLGEVYEVNIVKDLKNKYEASYKLEGLSFTFPRDTESQKKYIVATIGEHKAKAIYDYYINGEDVIQLIFEDKLDYNNIKGLGEKSFKSLRDRVLELAPKKALMTLLSPFGVTMKTINKIFAYYKNNDVFAVESIKKNPYTLTGVKNIGFKFADLIAMELNHSRISSFRINSALKYVLEEASKDGDIWISKENLIKKASALMGINRKYVEEEIKKENYTESFIRQIDGLFTMSDSYANERLISTAILYSNENPIKFFSDDEINDFLKKYQSENSIVLEEKQLEFFHNWNNNTISFLVGGAGMGKTALMTILVELLKTKELPNKLMAPTGKSSKVLSEYVGEEASTIHRALDLRKKEEGRRTAMTKEEKKEHAKMIKKLKKEWNTNKRKEALKESGELKHVSYEELNVKNIIVDEASMADVELISTLLGRVDLSKTKVLFVGDDYQLPSVGVGNFLYDCIQSGVANVTRLQKVFRQKEGGILDIATKVREEKPFLTKDMEGPYRFGKDTIVDLTNQSSVPFAVDYYYEQMLNDGYSPDEIMILAPNRIGKTGTVSLNNQAQLILDPVKRPSGQGLTVKREGGGTTIYHVGDLIINTTNSYDRDSYARWDNEYKEIGRATIFNGDSGKILSIINEEVYAEFDGIIMKFTRGEMNSMMLHSYCITINRAQGSASKAVILVLDKSATFQLNANLIYTGITRAKEKLVIIGQANTIINSCRKFVNMKRKSFLCDMLQGKI